MATKPKTRPKKRAVKPKKPRALWWNEKGEPVTPDDLREELRHYEERFGMTTEEFIRKWCSGEAPDTADNNWWAIAHNTYLAICRDYEKAGLGRREGLEWRWQQDGKVTKGE